MKNNLNNLQKIFFLAILFSVFFFGTPSASAERFFQQDNTWHQKIPNNPKIINNSSVYINYLSSVYNNLLIAGSAAVNPAPEAELMWSTPIYYATESFPLVQFNLASCHPTKPEWCTVPVPPEAVPEHNERQCNGIYADGSMAIVSADRKYLWEFVHVKHCETMSDGNGDEDNQCEAGENCYWYSYVTRRWDLTTGGVNQPYDGLYGVRVSKVPETHGIIHYKEITVDKKIDHALAMFTSARYATSTPTLYKGTNSWYPTYISQGFGNGEYANTNGLHLGMRLQLDPSYNCSALSNEMRRIVCVALQEYGMIFVENTGPNDGHGVYLESLAYKPESWYGIAPGILNIPMTNFRIVEPVCSDPYWCPDNLVSSADTTPPAAPSGLSVQ